MQFFAALCHLLGFRVLSVAGLFVVLFALSSLAIAQTINFESPTYTVGSVNDQDGWNAAGSAGLGCAVYDEGIVANNTLPAPLSFGAQSFRISNAVTSGCFVDQAFSKPTINEAGETDAHNGGLSGGIRQSTFVTQFNIASADPSAQQPGLVMSTSQDRGDGARMSYLRFEDRVDGVHVYFDDYQDRSPFGTALGDNANGCGVGDDFYESDIATLSRTAVHSIKVVTHFVDGPRNDVVQVYIDGVLKKTGTSWEDYYRYCSEQSADNQTKTVDSQLFRAGGTAAPSTAGKGFLIDDLLVNAPSTLVVDDDMACPGATFSTIQAAVGAANPGDLIQVCSGTYNEDADLNKAGITLSGAGAGSTTISGPIGGATSTIRVSASDVEISGFTITRDGNNTTDWNDPGLNSAGVSVQGQAITGMQVHDNVFIGNRTGIDVNNSNGHTIRNNIIDNNRTGLIFRNQTDNITFTENQVTNNWTVGVLFLDASGGTNVPVQTSLNSNFTNNNFSGNWYGQIVDRQMGGSLPAPGTTNLKNFRGNWFGIRTPVITTANSAEPGYAAQIPVIYGGTATPPSGQPDIAGPASANFQITPLLTSGSDTNVETAGGRGTFGFQGAPAQVTPSFLDGWSAVSQRTAAGTFVGGPGTPPLGVGSYRMTTGAGNSGPDLPQGGAGTGGKTWLTTQQYDNTPLANITDLSYSTYVASAASPSIAISLQLQVDLDGNGTRDATMVFEPVYSPDQGTITPGVWQNWNALSGKWWFPGNTFTNSPGFAFCPNNCFVPFSSVIAAYPNAKIVTWYPLADGYGVQFVGGQNSAGNPWINFDGNVDNFRISVNTTNTTYDFDPDRPSVTINQASGQADPTSSSPVNFTVTFSTSVTGFDSSDVVLGGTAGATTALVSGSGATYNVAVSGMTGSGTVIATIPDGAASDASTGSPSAASTSADNSVTYFTCNNVAVTPSTMVPRNTQFTVPITTDDLTGRGILSFDITLTYDPVVMTPISVDNAGTLSSAMTITYANSSGSLSISGFGTAPLAGSGTLINVKFISIGGISTTSGIDFGSFMYNEGVPCSNTTGGNVTVISGNVNGTVTYANNPGPTPVPVPGTVLNGAGSVAVSASTDSSGQYNLSGFGPGPYTVTPSKTGNVNGISALDSAKIAQHVVHIITMNGTQQLAADVSGNGTVSSLDAAYIAQWYVHIANPSSTGTWKFVPATRSYTDVETDNTSQDYGAILMGDVTGNWSPTATDQSMIAAPVTDASAQVFGTAPRYEVTKRDSSPTANAASTVNVTAPTLAIPPASSFTIQLQVGDTTGLNIIAYSYILNFDESVIVPQATPCDVSGSMSSTFSATCNHSGPGVLEVAVFGTTPLSGSGVLMNLHFTIVGALGTSSPLTLNNFMFNEGDPGNSITNGQVTVQSTTAAKVSAGGTVMRSNGQGVKNARVSVTDANGSVREVKTNRVGAYRVKGLEAGKTYIFNATAKGLKFQPRPVTVLGDMTNINLTAQP